MAARSATPDFGDDGVDEVDGRFPEPVAEPRSDADDPPALTSGFFGRRKVVPPIGEAKTPTSTKSRTSQAEEKLEEMLESGKHFLEGLGTGRHGVKRQDTLDKNYWLSLEDEASKSKQFGSHPDLILKQKNRKKCRLRSIEQCEFPKSLKDKNLWVLNPQNRYSWDLTILVLIILVMVLAPFEIAFVRASVGFNRNACNTNHAGPECHKGFLHPDRVGLFVVNLFIDICFVADIFLTLNTAYFDSGSGDWVIDHWHIFLNYLRSWLILDILSVLPWEFMQINGNASVLRLAKCMRLLKLLRVLKQPRIMARLNRHCTIRAEMLTVMKYLTLFMFQIHFGACILRAIDGEVLRQNCDFHEYRDMHMRHFDGAKPGFGRGSDHCPMDLVKGECPVSCPLTVLGFYWNQGIWPQYIGAIAWTLGCMQGELNGNNVAELLLNVAMSIAGMIILAFLVGDLCNAVSNMDPVKNDFTLAFDSLNNYIDEVKPPPSLRYKLREFMSLSEVVFREDYHRGLLERLSPGLLSVVAQHNLAGIVVQLPFYVDTLHRAYNLLPTDHLVLKGGRNAKLIKIIPKMLALQVHFEGDSQSRMVKMEMVDGTRFVVKYPRNADDVQHDKEDTFKKRWATLIRVHSKFLLCDVLFDEKLDENFKRFQTIPMNWIDTHSYGTAHSKARMARALYEENRFVVAVTQRLTTRLYMPKDTLIRNNCSLVDEMYVVHSGKAMTFGRHTVQLLSIKFKGVDDIMGDDICTLLVGDRLHRRRHFTAKAESVLHVFVLNGDTFCEIVESGSFDEFRLGVKRYGCFLRIQRALIIQTRARMGMGGCTLANSHAMTYEEQATEALSPRSMRRNANLHLSRDEEQALESDRVLSALRDVQSDLAKLAAAPAAVRRAFAEDNGDLAALAPVFGDLKRRVVGALAKKVTQGRRQRLSVVSRQEEQNIQRAAGFRQAVV
ncbi:unnamed protein product [Pelagomonas calceolata]|uniref:Ion transport domain-containing protein n=1 Tax=Pelagomonas calceolata TaxID=35677 RepID=A0A8J2SAL2_9STRA|nr:unnamed protein product [Pelagomonas calceolata]